MHEVSRQSVYRETEAQKFRKDLGPLQTEQTSHIVAAAKATFLEFLA